MENWQREINLDNLSNSWNKVGKPEDVNEEGIIGRSISRVQSAASKAKRTAGNTKDLMKGLAGDKNFQGRITQRNQRDRSPEAKSLKRTMKKVSQGMLDAAKLTQDPPTSKAYQALAEDPQFLASLEEFIKMKVDQALSPQSEDEATPPPVPKSTQNQ